MVLRKSVCLNFVFGILGLFLLVQTSFAQTGWEILRRNSAPGDFVSVYFTSSERGWVGGDKGYLAATIDGGKNWTRQPLNTTEDVNEIYFRNDDTGYLLAGSKIYITKDGGKNWRENIVIKRSEFKGLTPTFLSVRFSDKKRGWIVGSLDNKDGNVMDSLILQTLDSGETWTRVSVPFKQELYHADFVSDTRGWIVGDKGLILRTEDGGNTWNKQNSGVNASLFNVDFRDSDFGTVVGGEGTILRTENGGATWSKIAIANEKSFLRVNFITDKTGWIVGGGGTILRTDDKGRTWSPENAQITESLFGLYTDKKGGWAVGKKGIILKYNK